MIFKLSFELAIKAKQLYFSINESDMQAKYLVHFFCDGMGKNKAFGEFLSKKSLRRPSHPSTTKPALYKIVAISNASSHYQA